MIKGRSIELENHYGNAIAAALENNDEDQIHFLVYKAREEITVGFYAFLHDWRDGFSNTLMMTAKANSMEDCLVKFLQSIGIRME